MSLKLTNTLSRKKELFTSLKSQQISIYCCGVTVYDLCHLGHARSYLNWDVLRRYLIWEGNKVTFVQNFTDIDDKIINKAIKEGCSIKELVEKNILEFHRDMDSLKILRPDKMPRATKCLHEIKSLINELKIKGVAYEINGDVYFSVKDHLNYGKLSGRNLSDQKQNAEGRITAKEEAQKLNAFDFALWKKAKKGETSYSSPWGDGRPGWHIECSAMVKKELGETIDIHLGGSDLIFPHHENEIAQSEVANGKPLANYWLHNGMVNVDGEKMSKSLGNFTTIRDLLNKGISPMTLRFFVLQAHYRKPLDFTEDSLKSAKKGWERLNKCLLFGNIHYKEINLKNHKYYHAKYDSKNENLNSSIKRFKDFMDDDLNTSAALSIIFELCQPIRKINNLIEKGDFKDAKVNDLNLAIENWFVIVELAGVLGLKEEASKKSKRSTNKTNNKDIESLIKERDLAKSIKDYKKSDEIRTKLKDLGIKLIDRGNGITDWEIDE